MLWRSLYHLQISLSNNPAEMATGYIWEREVKCHVKTTKPQRCNIGVFSWFPRSANLALFPIPQGKCSILPQDNSWVQTI